MSGLVDNKLGGGAVGADIKTKLNALIDAILTAFDIVAGVVTFTDTPVLSAGADFDQNEAISMAIENRTSDPSTPVTGQIWLRTDV